jgi:hypothetical protein
MFLRIAKEEGYSICKKSKKYVDICKVIRSENKNTQPVGDVWEHFSLQNSGTLNPKGKFRNIDDT